MPYPSGAFKSSGAATQNVVDTYTQQKVKDLQKQRNASESAAAKKKAEEAANKRLTKLNQQLNAVNNDIKNLKIDMDNADFKKSKAQKDMAEYVATNNLPFNKALWTSGQRAAYAVLEKERDYWDGIYKGYKSRYDSKVKERSNIELNIKQGGAPYNSVGPHGAPGANQRATNQRNNSTNPVVPPVKPQKEVFTCYYNAPLVSQANFKGIQAEVLGGNFITSGNYTDALNAFKVDKNSGNIIVGRGSFQTDRVTRNATVAGTFSKQTSYNKIVDNNMYGFKFLYNPQTITMNWGALAKTDPVYASSAADPYLAGTANLVSSTIEFSIVLNRIEDMLYLGKNGLVTPVEPGTVNTNTLEGITRASNAVYGKNPYPQFSLAPGKTLNEELAEIYEEGTMYDLKYLFRTLHAQGAYATYKSSLQNQITADPGWLPVRPVELHLGNKLRYRVRVSNLSVNHTIFNSRMIPIFTTVNISCSRYWDDVGGIGEQK